jgi:uncharacterized membrane protein HdeD (DUF308 family)
MFIISTFIGVYYVIQGLLSIFPSFSGSENTDSNSPLLETVLFGFFTFYGSLIAIIFGF